MFFLMPFTSMIRPFLCRKVEEDNMALLSKVRDINPDLYEYAQEYLQSEKKLLPVIEIISGKRFN